LLDSLLQENRMRYWIVLLAVLAASASAAVRPAAAPREDLLKLVKQIASPQQLLHGLHFAPGGAGRVKRDACEDATDKFGSCVMSTTHDFIDKTNIGGDGRADYFERKTCNYLEDLLTCMDFEACGWDEPTKLGLWQAELPSLEVSLSAFPNWDGNKCPAYRYMKYGEPMPTDSDIIAAPAIADLVEAENDAAVDTLSLIILTTNRVVNAAFYFLGSLLSSA